MKAFLLLVVVTMGMVMTMTGAQTSTGPRLRFVGFQLSFPWRLVYYESCPIGLPAGTVASVTARPPGVNILSCNTLTPSQYRIAASAMTQACGGVQGISPLCTYHMCTVQEFSPNWGLIVTYPSGNTCDVNRDAIGFIYAAVSPVRCCP